MLNCIYQDIVVEKVSQEFSPSGISEKFLEMKIIIKHLVPLSDYRATHLVFFLCQSPCSNSGFGLEFWEVDFCEILAGKRIIYSKKYWNVFAFFERRVQMVNDLF